MSRLVLDRTYEQRESYLETSNEIARRLKTNLEGNCPLEVTSAFLKLCAAQSCGKCVPCRIGVTKMANLIDSMLDGEAKIQDLSLLHQTAENIYKTADCAIGFEAGRMALHCVEAYADEFQSHIEDGRCVANFIPIPCVSECPAHVDVPSYIAAVKAGRLQDAIKIIRNDNPFPSVCGYVCEHPCETACRRQILDAPVNIRGIKKYAADNAGTVPTPEPLESTGKKIAIVGGGPAGLTCAYYLRLMGHDVTVFEKNEKLGGMLLYGIPRYRLPDEALAFDVDAIINTGVDVRFNTEVGVDMSIEDLEKNYDGVFIAIGAHTGKGLGIPGEDLPGVYSAVDVLYRTSGGFGEMDLTGKDVVVVGGGNVAMDAARTAKRMGANSVSCVYRRRIEDMVALPEEVRAAISEGVKITPLVAPVRIEETADGRLDFVGQPQVPGPYQGTRPKPIPAEEPETHLDCDVVIAAIGQDIVSEVFEAVGFGVNRKRFVFEYDCTADVTDSRFFVGGDCATGPATVIRAIAAGKVAAFNIDEMLGYAHDIRVPIHVPPVEALEAASTEARGRIVVRERYPSESAEDFDCVEIKWTKQESDLECSRCLGCDKQGFNSLREGRQLRW